MESNLGSTGAITVYDNRSPERGKVTIPVYSFGELSRYMDAFKSDPGRYSQVTWEPNLEVLKPFTREV